ncbi:MAG: nitrous oxide-stimulated promoter family protein [Desulfuromonadales bacterium]|nr:MAG: nitrous oxide-stimulated promoter family protein [Desulfuromonadales bacterium]
MEQFTRDQQKDLKVIIDFVRVYCHARHERAGRAPFELPQEMTRHYGKGVDLCPECAGLLAHGITKRRICPLDPKPSCKHCRIHCYSREYRAKIREVMGFSGRRMIMRGRLDYLWHYFF